MRSDVLKNIDAVRGAVAETILLAARPVLLWSGGMDSGLLLSLAREILPEIAVLQFRTDWRREQSNFSDALILDWNLKVIVYAPVDRFVLPNGEGITLVDDYDVRGERLPVIRDALQSDDYCILDAANAPRTAHFAFPFDAAVVGWRGADSHFAFGEKFGFPQAGTSIFHAPLFDFSKEEVAEMAEFLKVPLSQFYATGDERLDTGNILACHRCLSGEPGETVFCPKQKKQIPVADWNKAAALQAFRARFN